MKLYPEHREPTITRADLPAAAQRPAKRRGALPLRALEVAPDVQRVRRKVRVPTAAREPATAGRPGALPRNALEVYTTCSKFSVKYAP
jgi:hypothetical protein